jgi:hypothetical protein
MKRFTLVVLVAVLTLALGACTCTAEKGAVSRLEQQQDKLASKYLKYVDADPAIGGPNATEEQRKKAREDERLLIQSLKDITTSLKKSLGD